MAAVTRSIWRLIGLTRRICDMRAARPVEALGERTMPRQDWILMALAQKTPLDPVQIQKALFLMGREMADEVGQDFYQFRPYNYGPFDQRIYQDIEQLALRGHIAITQEPRGVR